MQQINRKTASRSEPSEGARVAGVVVTYNPDVTAVMATLESVSVQVETLFVIDNSDRTHDLAVQVARLANVQFVDNHGNQGIAHALNVALELSAQASLNLLLTLDQDSLLPAGYVSQLVRLLDARHDRSVIAIAGGEYLTAGVREGGPVVPSDGEVDFLITSGNLLDVDLVSKAGGFRTEFFIDYVDMDLCFRLRKRGLKVIQHPSLTFRHRVGDSQWSKIGNVSFVASHHSAFRRYYMTRNRLVFFKDNLSFATGFVLTDVYGLFKDTVKVVLVEDGKLSKLKAAALGLKDALLGTLGKSRYKF